MRWLGIFLIFFGSTGNAAELRELYFGARAQAMGNAFVGLADDEQAIFMNPAGLAGNKKFTFNYMALDLAASTDIVTSFQEGLTAFQNLSGDSLNVVIGKNIYTRAQLAPSLLMPNLGVAVLVDGQAGIFSQNKALPQIMLGYQTTNGFQVAYGMRLGRGYRLRGDFRVGVAGKMLWRRGGYYLIPFMDLVTVGKDTLSKLTGNFERGMGLDLGSQYIHNFNSRFSLGLGLVYTDIGDTSFGKQANPIKSSLDAGMALTYSLRVSKVVFTYDMHHLTANTDWRRKNHLGLELALPFISLYGGINQVSLTYGTIIDLWWLKITALSYAEDIGAFVHINSSRRWVLKLGMKFNL